MYDIRQFKPALYVLLLLGISGFALASQRSDVGALSISAIVLNAWLIKTKRFSAIPHWLANIITIIALLCLLTPLHEDPSRAVLVIGEFLVALQIVKLYEQRGNRDYAQLLVLSLLLMVAASINTASLIFGIMLIAYLFLSLYCCLLFHLKVETDSAKEAIGLPENIANPATLRQDQRFLAKSMRRLTLAVSVVAIFMAVTVFLLFPRGAGAGLLGPLQFKPSEPLSGFSDTVSFQRIATIAQNNTEIAWVRIYKDGALVRGTIPLLLRGLTLDVYSGNATTLAPSRTWTRSETSSRDPTPDHDLPGVIAPATPRWRQEITLDPTGTQALFAMPGLCRLDDINTESSRPRYFPADQVLQSTEVLNQRIQYTVESTGHVLEPIPDEDAPSTEEYDPAAPPYPPPMVSFYSKPIEDFARRPEVSGSDARGPLAAQRKKTDKVNPLDPMIAQNICTYLQRNFTYTLDLSDAAKIGEDRDPLVAFLYDFKRGHCEYFAGSMALMCQSLGMQARVVVGFKCDEYNPMLQKYVVKQSMAHAWVEVLDPKGEWETFDPTSGRGDDDVKSNAGVWRHTIQFFQFLEYTWADSVVAYDRDSRANLISNVDRSLTNTAINSTVSSSKIRDWIESHEDAFALHLTPILFAGMIAVIIVSVFWYLLERWRLHRRAKRIGLDDLPASDQLRLVRQLAFYDQLLQLLERHRIVRPHHLTPLEFSRSIEFLPHEVFDAIHRLTAIFYRVRYGRHELTPAQQRHLAAVITRINAAMAQE
jgi:protein-glutamine gamma-glutamyltransferase